MPDITSLLAKRWKLIIGLTLVATLLALVVSLVRPKEYLSTVTALPANSLTADRARIFSSNIESLYPEIGTPDELDRIEGTTKLDTLYLAVADSLNLAPHYGVDKNEGNSTLKAAWTLKTKTDIRRSAYGELKIKVWDGDPALAAQIANALFNKLNAIHQDIQNANNTAVLNKLKKEIQLIIQKTDSISLSFVQFETANADNPRPRKLDSLPAGKNFYHISSQQSILNEQVKEYYRLIAQYELGIKTIPQVLIAVEYARPAFTPDKPKTLQTTLLAFAASLVFSFLLALFAESRNATT